MKNILKLFIAAVIVFVATGCHSPEELTPSVVNQGINSISAQFATGEYKNDIGAKFTQAVTDPNVEEIVITIPYYYPEASSNLTEITKMRVTASIDDNCTIEPKLGGMMDLTKKNYFTLTKADGTKKTYCVSGVIKKSNKCDIISFTTSNPTLQGIIDTDAKTISLISADDLSAVTASVILAPHATISPDPAIAANYNDGKEFTVTAHDGTTKAVYTASKQVPNKIKYGWRKGSEREVWANTTLDTSCGITNAAGSNYTLAVSGDKLILSTGPAKYLFNRLTGTKLGEVNMKGVTTDGAVTSDAVGNILYATTANPSATFTIYKATSVDVTPTALITYTNATGASMGKRVSVQGDVTNNAVVTVPIYTWNGAVCKFVCWTITNGVVGSPKMVTVAGEAGWNGNGHADVVAGSTNANDAYFMSYYSANKMVRIDGASSAVTHTIKTATWGGNSNYNCIDVREFNNAKYAAVYTGSHFTYGQFLAFMFDVTTPDLMKDLFDTSPAKVFVSKEYTPPSAVNATGDIVMIASPDGYKLNLYYTDGNCRDLVAWEFDCIDK